mgnify:CR=1 FL=1
MLQNRKGDALLSLRLRRRGTSLERLHHPVELRIIRPRKAAAPSPALLLIHGGGYVMGRARMDDRIASVYASELGIAVVSVEYRLAPEHPFPAGMDDCYAALTWLHRQPWVGPAAHRGRRRQRRRRAGCGPGAEGARPG